MTQPEKPPATPPPDLLAERATSGDVLLLCFLTLLNVLNFVDRQLLASFANFIVPDLGLSNTEFGLLTGFAFIVFYAVMGLFMGALADRLHRPRLIAAGLALWSLLTAASGAARNFATLAVPRMLIGVGESALTPASMSLITDRFPSRLLGFAAGFYYMGVPIGVGCSLLVAGYLGPAIGWRNCFYLLGAVGLVLAVVLLFVKEVPRRGLATGTAPPRQSFGEMVRVTAKALRSSPALLYTIAGGVALPFVLGAAAFDQLWFVQERGFDRVFIAQASGWIGMVGGIMGNLFGGAGSDWFMRRFNQGRPMFLFWLGIVFAPVGFVYRLAPGGSFWFWLGLFLGFFQLGTFYGPTFSTVQELVPTRIRATVVAFYILMLNLVGLGIGITGGGIMVDALIARGVPEPYTKTLLTFTVISASAMVFFFLAGRSYHRDKERLEAEWASGRG